MVVEPAGEHDEGSRLALQGAMELLGFTFMDLWLAQVAIGGTLTVEEVLRLVVGVEPTNASHYTWVADALNDHLIASNLAYRVPCPGETTSL